ncbi:four helix bundle protein [Candidatus Omnitrophota bacterium]
MNNETRNIHERVFEFVLSAVILFKDICKQCDQADKIIGKQFMRSATSIGANIEEAQSAESKADFIHKYSISQKEANESQYWLKMIKESCHIKDTYIDSLLTEIDELISIITTIIINTKNKK